ncbi:MAG TPA: nitroreductase/quinone reductase family protein [Rugosimonospora sp.]
MPMNGNYAPSPHAVIREQVERFERSGGPELSYPNKMPMIVLTTRGARTGLIRKTPLMRVECDGRYLAVASVGGAERNPQWLYNLRADPAATLQDGPDVHALRSRELSGDERAQWWAYALQTYPLYAEYQTRTERVIPVVLLEPADPAGSAVRWIDGYDGLVAAIGEDLGASPWLTVEQPRIDSFAETTGDHAWIHVDPQRAAAGPYRATIAHGLLTLSVVTRLGGDVFRVCGLSGALHYGYDRVRFLRPVPVGSRIRVHMSLRAVDGDRRRTKAHYHASVEVDGMDSPACVADLIYFYEFPALDQ